MHDEADSGTPPRPVVGDDVYVPTDLYLSHGRDDFIGGRCRITRIRVGNASTVLFESSTATDASPAEAPLEDIWVEVEERPGRFYSWKSLLDEQDELRREFGDRRGHPDPDLRPEFNE